MQSWACGPLVARSLYVTYRIKEAFRVRRSCTRLALEHRSRFYADLWLEAATRCGADIESLGDEVFEIRVADACTRVLQNTTSIENTITVAVAQKKPLVHRLLARRKLRTPAFCEFTLSEIGKAAAFIERINTKCVVKPADGGGGRGVTTGITGTLGLLRASAHASVYGPDLLVEQQMPGDVYRLLYLDGVLLDAVLRKPCSVIGDGHANIRELIRRHNALRLRAGPRVAHALIETDMDVRNTLTAQSLTLSSVPTNGAVVAVKKVINDNSQPDNISAKEMLCSSVIRDGAAAAAEVGARLAGIDVITPDPGVSLEEAGGAILEVNTSPSYHHHYYKRDGGYPVAVHLLPLLLNEQLPKPQTRVPLIGARNA